MKKITILFLVMGCAFTASISYAQTEATLNHTAIFVTDLKASFDFYSNVIGLDTIPEPFHDKKHAWFRTAPGVSLHIIEGAKEKKAYFLNQHTCFSVASVDAFVEILKKRNIVWYNGREEKMKMNIRVDGVKQVWIQDPDGYWIEINDAKN